MQFNKVKIPVQLFELNGDRKTIPPTKHILIAAATTKVPLKCHKEVLRAKILDINNVDVIQFKTTLKRLLIENTSLSKIEVIEWINNNVII